MADSESSTVRGVALPAGSVKAVVGGAIDPLVRRFFSATIDSISNGYEFYVHSVCSKFWPLVEESMAVFRGMS